MTAARWWRRDGELVVCELCPHRCRLSDGEPGACGTRWAAGGVLRSLAAEPPAVVRIDSIERKFLYHVAPGARCLSSAVAGCNLRCRYCQNWMVSQTPTNGAPAAGPAVDLVDQALAVGCQVVAATYTEPTVFLEQALAVAAAARDAGLLNVWKTNGFIEPGPQAEACALLDAVNVDLKSFDPAVHRRLTGAPLAPVLEAVRRYRAAGLWVEVTTLVIPTVNDGPGELAALGAWIRDELGADTPWHLNRFHPDWELRDLPPTPAATLHAAREAALATGLRYVYTDVEPAGRGWDTHCPGCGSRLLTRAQYALVANHLRPAGACPTCGRRLPGLWVTASGWSAPPCPESPARLAR